MISVEVVQFSCCNINSFITFFNKCIICFFATINKVIQGIILTTSFTISNFGYIDNIVISQFINCCYDTAISFEFRKKPFCICKKNIVLRKNYFCIFLLPYNKFCTYYSCMALHKNFVTKMKINVFSFKLNNNIHKFLNELHNFAVIRNITLVINYTGVEHCPSSSLRMYYQGIYTIVSLS